MMRLLLALLCVTGSPWALSAQSLYIGEQEIDTADREAVAEVVQHCEDLADPQAPAAAPNATAEPLAGDAVEPPVAEQDAFSKPLTLDALISSGDGAEAAGEGTGSGVPASGEDTDRQVSAPVLEDITLELCKEAGILY